MSTKTILFSCLALATVLGSSTWDKAPEKWNLKDVYRILQDSPWSPAESKLIEAEFAPGEVDPQTGVISDRTKPNPNAQSVPGIRLHRDRPQPVVPVLWWSSKTIRLAEQRLRQLHDPSHATQVLQVDELPDYVLVIEGSEHLRLFRDAKDDLRDTVFLELPNGSALDLASVRFVEGAERDEPRTEFHFPREIDGRATIDANWERVIFHCKATAKTVLPSHENSLALRAEFKPRAMRVRGAPDL